MRTLVAFMAGPVPMDLAQAPDALCLGFLKACLADAPASMMLPQPEADAALPPLALEACAQALPLTPGAARLLMTAGSLFKALQIILNDRSFRQALRAHAAEQGKERVATGLIAMAPELGALLQPAPARTALPKIGARPAPQRTAAPAGPASAPPAEWASIIPAHLMRYASLPVSTSARAGEGTMRVGELILALSQTNEPLSRLTVAMRSLAGSANRVALVLLQRAVLRGEVSLRPDAVFHLMAETARALVTLNANDSAYRITSALVERCGGDRGMGLAQEDLTRLTGLQARICVRTGRVAEAEQLFRRLHSAQPADGGFALEYFLSMFTTKPEEAAILGRGMLAGGTELDYLANLALAEFFIQHDSWVEATAFLIRAARMANGRHQHILTSANIALRRGDEALWRDMLKDYGWRAGMPLAGHDPSVANRVFSFEGAGEPQEPCPEPISVMMTAFNSAATIEAAMDSVLAQRGVSVELIVIDDGSTDGTREILAARAAVEPRLRVVMNTRNMGTYASKNHGMSISNGALLAFHDSDDWMHPLHLYRQAERLQGGYVCTTSQWLRMRGDGYVIQRRAGGYAHLNPASTLFRRAVVDEMGPFDFVRTGADAEYVTRIRLRYGWNSVQQMEDCLALGLHHEGSLTQSGATAFDEHRYSPVRLAYTEAWVAHHLSQLEQMGEVALRAEHDRPFAVPEEIRS